MLVSAPEAKIRGLDECHGYRSYAQAIAKLLEYDARPEPYRVTFTRFGRYWYIHAYTV